MHLPPIYRLFLLATLASATSCTSLNITNYYHKHRYTLDGMEQVYQKAYQVRHFSIEFTDRAFDHVSLEFDTDTLTYIYEFAVGERRMQDTIVKYGYDTAAINNLITNMQSMECTWINNLDYYANETRHSLIYISLWPKAFNLPFVNKKYYILTYFSQPQYFNADGNLMTGRRLRRIRKINGETFRKINAKVCYTISAQFR
ncbi:MAG TPA: hypothetical protein VG052_16035 [Puia sp.]|jgi:hypothetical protein|nr:hypothetical protein [Puia sp.]